MFSGKRILGIAPWDLKGTTSLVLFKALQGAKQLGEPGGLNFGMSQTDFDEEGRVDISKNSQRNALGHFRRQDTDKNIQTQEATDTIEKKMVSLDVKLGGEPDAESAAQKLIDLIKYEYYPMTP